MGDRGGNRGRGGGRERGDGQNRGGGSTHSGSSKGVSSEHLVRFEERTRNLNRAAKDVQKMLQELSLEKSGPSSSQKPDHKNKNSNRGSQSMMNLNSEKNKKSQTPQGRKGSQANQGSGSGRGGKGSAHSGHSQPHGNRGSGHSDNRGSGHSGHSQPHGGNRGCGRGGHFQPPGGNRGPTHPRHPSPNQGFRPPPPPPPPNRGPRPRYHAPHHQGNRPPPPPSQGPRPQYHAPHHQGNGPPYQPRQDYVDMPCKNAPPPSYDESNRQMYGQNAPPPLMGHRFPPPYPSTNFCPSEPPGVNQDYPPQYSCHRHSFPESYEKQPQRQEKPKARNLNPTELVQALSRLNGQWSKADQLSKQVGNSIDEVVKVVKSRKDVFSYMQDDSGGVIELVPKVSLCSDYVSPKGCVNKDSCKNLHICKVYVTEYCHSGVSCQFGHRWDTEHNNSILSKLYLDLIDKKDLHHVIRKVCKSASPKVCGFYNSSKGCKYNEKCGRLHICNEYVVSSGKCSSGKTCPLNHNILDGQCIKVVKQCNVSTNATPRDILLQCLPCSNMQFDDQPAADAASKKSGKDETSSKKSNKRGKGEKGKAQSSDSSDTESDEDSSCDDSDDSRQQDSEDNEKTSGKKKRQRKKKKNTTTTCRSTDLCGDVEIPEICFYAVNNKCNNEKKGCKYLHAHSLFHWQVDKDNKWYNLRVFQSKTLETAYRDVSRGSVQLAPLDPSRLETHAKELLNLFGNETWTGDFKNMCLINNSGSTKLKLRRVSTASAAVSDNPKSTVYEWYFVDDNGTWVCYGQVDSLGKQEFVCNIASEDIEKHYVKDASVPMVVCSANFSYKLDFTKMTQTNLKTLKEREIRRRPTGLSYQKSSSSESDQSSLPTNWTPMSANQTHVLKTLTPSDTDYQDVSSRVRLMLPSANIQKIQRLQNPYLWRLLQFKKAKLSQRYDENQLNMQKLFHGTDPMMIDTICKDNIDGRQDTTSKQPYGKGTYFSNSAAIALTNCTVDGNGHYCVVLADVLIGSVVQGAPTLTRPPMNPATNTQYDTTVDNVHAPTMFVKYDKDEYYPCYIVQFY